MRPFSKAFPCFLFLLGPYNSSIAETAKGELVNEAALDFNSDGRVDENDLLSLLARVGARIGQEKYSFRHDLETDGAIDDRDLLVYVLGWKGATPQPEPFSTADFRERTGLNDLSGATWRFRCFSGGTQDCAGQERTVTGGPLTEIGGRTVLPIIWGSGDGEPWDILYLTMDGNLAYMGVEKVAEPNGFPGILVPPQTIGISGPIPWTTSEVIYPGSILETTGMVSMNLGFSKGFELIDVICVLSHQMEEYYENQAYQACLATSGDDENQALIRCNYLNPNKGAGARPLRYSGTGNLETAEGMRAQADWDLLFGPDGLWFAQLCWDFMGQRKCLSYGRILDASGSGCPESIVEQEVEIEHCGVFHNDITEGLCLSGVVGSGNDIQDWIRLNQQGAAGRVAVTIRHSVPAGSEGLAQLWRFPPNCTAGDLLDFANFTGDGEAVVESPFITVGPNVYVIVSPEGDQGAAGGPIAYEVQFENQ